MTDNAPPDPTTPGWPEASPQPDLPAMEDEVLARWHEHDVFQRSLEQRRDGEVFSFYEGPPTANGSPGTHHVEARVFKDVFCRYRTMKGYAVPRKAGWDCHGLPVELEVEKELGLNSKPEIEAYGVEAFNERCRQSVVRYVGEFERLTERIGFWVDMSAAYRTMDPDYIDSLWWALKQLWDQGLIFEDQRVAPYCGRCGTGLSDAEVAQGYRTIEDPSVFVRFPVTEGPLADEGAALAVWTTTPWTLPSNVAVAIRPDIDYQLVATPGGAGPVVIAAARREAVLGAGAEVLRAVEPDELLGVHYEAPFTLVEPRADHRFVVQAGFVTTDEGSGLVHLAPAFGQEDMGVARREDLPVVNPVDEAGAFTTGPWEGRFVKDADPAIIEAMDEAGVLLARDTYEHTYPFCWRCDTPLIYRATPSWYIATTRRREELLANNQQIDWHPEHIRDGRFGNWLENNVDWALSRDRYWGTPLPFWRCRDCRRVTVVGSRAELSERTGRDYSELDPHRPYVDAVLLDCPECGGIAERVEDVADAWFDSGAMPFAQFGYPHAGTEEFDRQFPADFICEAIDQTRGWFYTLLAESTLLFDGPAYRTVLCLGHIVDAEGQKMSTSAGNVLDPFDLMDRHGADALRWLMFAEGNPWVNRRVGHEILDDIVRRFLLTLWNTHVFFLTYAAIDGFSLADEPPAIADRPAIDRWVLAELADAIDTVDDCLQRYDVTRATDRLEGFVDDLSNWYVRRTRERFWRPAGDDRGDKLAAEHTLHTCLRVLAQLLAPMTPFVADQLWHDLVVSQPGGAPVSVHLTDFPAAEQGWRDEQLRAGMATARQVVELGRQARNDAGIKVRQPLGRAVVGVPEADRSAVRSLHDQIAGELNVKEIELVEDTDHLVDYRLEPDFSALGPAFTSRAQAVGDAIREADTETAAGVAAALDGGRRPAVEVDGEQVHLQGDMLEVVETPRTGWAMASADGISIALDTTITRPLEVEGAARELMRALNELRRQADLQLDARIRVAIDVEPTELDAALEQQGWYAAIAREVLASEVQRQLPDGDGTAVDLGDSGRARINLR